MTAASKFIYGVVIVITSFVVMAVCISLFAVINIGLQSLTGLDWKWAAGIQVAAIIALEWARGEAR